MNFNNHNALQSEYKFLQDRLSALPDSAKITRRSVLSRLEAVAERLNCEILQKQPTRVRLTFSGPKVIGSHGVLADFGTKALKTFTEAVSTMAASLTAPVAAMGPIPNRDQYQLLITGAALGSFGFELEELSPSQMSLSGPSVVEQALERTQELLQGSIISDDELADSVEGLDRRVWDKIRAFVSVLAEDNAICAIQLKNRTFRFKDIRQVQESLARINQDNLSEEEQSLEGEFQGILPKGRAFEFKLIGQEDVIRGRIGPQIEEPDKLNDYLHQKVSINVIVTKVGRGRPRYLLVDQPKPQS